MFPLASEKLIVIGLAIAFAGSTLLWLIAAERADAIVHRAAEKQTVIEADMADLKLRLEPLVGCSKHLDSCRETLRDDQLRCEKWRER